MKQTEIGMIPDDWEVKEIKEFADVTTGNKNTQDAQENGKYPFYVRSPIVERINTFSFDSEGLVTAGDGVGTGKVFHFVKGKFGLHQRAYLIHKFQNVDSKYFYYIFSQNFYERVHSMTAKSSVDSVRREMITQMSIPLPPTLAEQQKIAKSLSDVDNVISTLEKLITKKKNLKHGTMQQLLTGKKRLPGFAPAVVEPVETTKFKQTEIGEIPEDWEVKSLSSIGEVKMCKRVLKYQTSETGEIPFYKIGTFGKEPDSYISRELFNFLKNNYSYPKKGDILISAAGTIGRTVVFDGKDSFFQDSNIVWLDNDESVISNYFLSYVFKIIKWQTEDGGIVSRLYNNNFRVTQIPIPSKSEQTAIANVLSSMDKEIEALEAKLGKYRDLKTGMMQQLLTGKIRL